MKKVIIIGGGINGLVAANYLQRSGFTVTMLEKKESIGGACASDTISISGKSYNFSNGASVFGFMQDFVFRETGLADNVIVGAPEHPEIVYFDGHEPCILHEDMQLIKQELETKWAETGNVEGFFNDLMQIRNFLIANFREARVPTMSLARHELGSVLAKRWISGSARDLLDHYFTSDKTKMFFFIEVTESGPVSFDSPYSAFNIALMNTGAIFEGKWGFVKGGIATIAKTLTDINTRLGVKLLTSADIQSASSRCSTAKCVEFMINGKKHVETADLLIFATDPVNAARLLHDAEMESLVKGKKLLGTSGKVVLFFDKPVKWKGETGEKDFDSAFRFIISTDSPDKFEASSKLVEEGKIDFAEGYFEIYCEGAGRRRLGEDLNYDIVAVFLKNFAFSKTGAELPEVKKHVEELILSKISNPNDLIGSVLFTPKDIKNNFFMPEGNIDHIELSDGQNFFARTFSANPRKRFYQFGKHNNVYYCGAGAYPCGSVAGTVGYMCAQEVIRHWR